MRTFGKTAGFGKFVEATVEGGRAEARESGSATVEAEHLLLAIAAGQDKTSRDVLGAVGLDHDSLVSALEAEFVHSLRAVGIGDLAQELPPPTRSVEPPANLSASAKLAIERATSVSANRLQPAHLLLGIVRAQVGTVPRALELAGIDRGALESRLLDALTEEPGHDR
ncbi:Clp protease [Nocardia uniformis]|uniref:Clp protease n=1 Tax=Nocardia uniformis TaxID=53432 RepID=A0A849BYR3_9NOCA|nr:Clp protease N-terminal domain-containing protein [Nocardia uniformis]NNH69245.1 Clp protease [Nocardia uniformis]